MWSVERTGRALALAALIAVPVTGRSADLSAIVATPQQGQSADRARRDRYECHNWAIEQTGVVPSAAPGPEVMTAERRAERVERVIVGAGIGAAVGSVVAGGHRDDAADGALVGGMLGALVGAATGRDRKARPPEDESFDAYFRALSACLTARGYEVALAE